MSRGFVSLMTVALIGLPTMAQAQAVRTIVESEKPRAVTGDPDRVVCRERKPTGTRLSKGKTCKSVKDWTASTAGSHEGVRALQRPGGLDATITGSARGPGNITLARPQ